MDMYTNVYSPPKNSIIPLVLFELTVPSLYKAYIQV